MKGVLLVLIFWTVSIAHCYAQYFNKLIDFDTTMDWGVAILPNLSGIGFNIICTAQETTGTETVKWMEMSTVGNVILKKNIIEVPNVYYELPTYAGAKTLSNNQGYVFPINFGSQNPLRVKAGLCKINLSGDTVFTASHTDTSQYLEYMFDCDTAGDKGFVIGGRRKLLGAPNATYMGVVQRLDSVGGLVWERVLTAPNNTRTAVNAIQCLPDGNILVGAFGGTYKVKPMGFPYVVNSPWFLILDGNDGHTVYEKFYPSRLAGGANIFKDVNGGYFHCGNLDSFLTSNPWNIENLPSYVAHLNDSFEIDWFHTFASFYSQKFIWQIEQLSDSGYIVTGNHSDTTFSSRYGWAARFDKHRNLKWERHYYVDSMLTGYIVDVLEKPGGGLVMTGMHQSKATLGRYQDVWVISTDSAGCPSSLECLYPLDVPEDPQVNTRLILYPNPTSGSLTVRSAAEGTVTIFNIQGIKVYSMNLKAGETSFSLPATLASGIYTAKFLSSEGKTEIARFIYKP